MHRPYFLQPLHSLDRIGTSEHLVPFVTYTFVGDDFQSEGILLHTLTRIPVDRPSETGSKPYTTENAQRVIIKYNVRSSSSTYQMPLYIVKSISSEVQEFPGGNISVERVNCKVTSHAVLLQGAESRFRVA